MLKKFDKFLLIAALCLFFSLFVSVPNISLAREPNQIFDWYVKDFETEIIVNLDSSLLITENITADCGNLPNKHGIYRVLATWYQKTKDQKVKTPIELVGITDFNGNPWKYKTSYDRGDGTITWKIGDPDITVSGENYYKIVYLVKNAIRFDDPRFDEFYWNLLGNFWELEIDNFRAKIIFPNSINKDNTEISYYVGFFGQGSGEGASYRWLDKNILEFQSTRVFSRGEGLTTSVTFPKGIIKPYTPTFIEKYGHLFYYLLPLAIFILVFRAWFKYGRDPKLGKTITPEFGVPENLSPMKLGALLSNGRLEPVHITASIINLAVNGLLRIEEIPKKGIVGNADTKLILVAEEGDLGKISPEEKLLLSRLFSGPELNSNLKNLKEALAEIRDYTEKLKKEQDLISLKLADLNKKEILISSLKNKFYKDLEIIKNAIFDQLKAENIFGEIGFRLQLVFLSLGIISVFISFFATAFIGGNGAAALAACGVILIIFSILMPQRTLEGAELLWRVRGFRYYMLKAEKYRQQFFEKENLFEKLLPYAMVFGIAKIWAKKMKEIFGEEYSKNYRPTWYAGAAISSFNFDDFTAKISSVSATMASTLSSIPSSSGHSGGGFSGGGGGGGW